MPRKSAVPCPDNRPVSLSAPTAPAQAAPPDHYENFPVASWLCPPRLRPPIAALYAFARTADDIADEGEATPAARLTDLVAYQKDLARTLEGEPPSDRWLHVFNPLRKAVVDFALPGNLLNALLHAFAEDVSRDKARCEADQALSYFPDRTELMGYCQLSANPIGRLLLHLADVDDARARAQSDAICSALQLVNFWQDLSVDLPRGRFYLPLADCAAHGLSPSDFQRFLPLGEARPPKPARALVAREVQWARDLMHDGAPLVHRMPGRMGWELRLVVQGGLAILDKIEALGFDSFTQRPTVTKADAPRLLWRALRMKPHP